MESFLTPAKRRNSKRSASFACEVIVIRSERERERQRERSLDKTKEMMIRFEKSAYLI